MTILRNIVFALTVAVLLRAGPNKVADTSVTGEDQFWDKFLETTKDGGLGPLQKLALKSALDYDVENNAKAFQALIRATRE